MDDPARVSKLLLESAAALGEAGNARAVIVAVDALPEEIETLPTGTILVVRDEHDQKRAEGFGGSVASLIKVPNVELDRVGQVKLAAIIALSNRTLDREDSAVFLTGPFRSLIDTLMITHMGAEYELLDLTHQEDLKEHIRRAVFYRVLSLALHLGQHGRESRNVGALLVVGNHRQVMEQSEQMILNPFKGYA